MRQCSVCSVVKQIHAKDMCDRCYKAKRRQIPEVLERKREVSRNYYYRHKKRITEKQKKNIEHQRDIWKHAREKYAEKNKEMIKIKDRDYRLISLKDKCEYCGSNYLLQRHHIDYINVKVVTLCKTCHAKQHRKKSMGVAT